LCKSATQGNSFGAVNYGLQLANQADINQSISFLKVAMNEGNSFAKVLLFESPENIELTGLSKMPVIQLISYLEILVKLLPQNDPLLIELSGLKNCQTNLNFKEILRKLIDLAEQYSPSEMQRRSFLVEVNPQIPEDCGWKMLSLKSVEQLGLSRGEILKVKESGVNLFVGFERTMLIELYLSPLFALKTKVGDPIYSCTLCQTGVRFVDQKWYNCLTCTGLTENVGCCEICARICHAGHTLSAVKKGGFYCDCGVGGLPFHCKCITGPSTSCCTYLITGRRFMIQKWYNCLTCFDSNRQGCCEICARICHVGHNLVFAKKSRFYCDCGAGSCRVPCKCIPFRSMMCTYRFAREEKVYICKTCPGSPVCCSVCSRYCHMKHKLMGPVSDTRPCGCVNEQGTCKCSGQFVSLCTRVRMGNVSILQPLWDCKTCGLMGENGCCEVCAMTCHGGHEITFGEVQTGICGCQTQRPRGCFCTPQ
jgi:hypothetical protein